MLGQSFWIDVSHHDGVIDWRRVRQFGVEGAVVRIGDGTLNAPRGGSRGQDSRYEENIVGAIDNDIFVANYYFWYDHLTPQFQYDVIRGILKHRVPSCLFIDVEDYSYQAPGMTITTRTRRLMALVDMLTEAGYRIGFYTAKWTWDTHILDTGDWDSYVQWVAYWPSNPESIQDTSRIPMPNGWNNLELWQYSATGEVDGIDRNDEDLDRGMHPIEWYQSWNDGTTPPPPADDLEPRVAQLESQVAHIASNLKIAGTLP